MSVAQRRIAPAASPERPWDGAEQKDVVGKLPPLLESWPSAVEDDVEYQEAYKAVKEKRSRFPPELRLKTSISECGISASDKLTFRDRVWVPNGLNLRTRVLQEVHDSTTHAHPGREVMYAIVARQYYWPGLSRDLRQLIGNCDSYRSNKA